MKHRRRVSSLCFAARARVWRRVRKVKPRRQGGARRSIVAEPRRDAWPALDRLRERLRAAGYGPGLLRDLLGIRMPDDVGLLNIAAMRERLGANPAPAAVLVRLFHLECPEKRAALAAVLPRAEQEALAGAGLLAFNGARVRARLRIDVVGDLCLLADHRFSAPDLRALGLPAGDMVYPPGTDSALLAPLAASLARGRVLDLCAGTGVQGLAAAPHADRVVGVDIGRRAAALAAANARLNGIAHLEVRCGNLYRAAGGERFDLIIANPPFVASPRRGPAYHSGGPYGDRVLARVVRGWAGHLNPSGRGIAISHLALRPGERPGDRVRPWLEGFSGRALLLLLEKGTPVDLAAAQALFALEGGLAAYAVEVRRWAAYLNRHRVAEIVLCVLVGECGRRRGLDVVEAFQRTLPLPLTPPPADHLSRWLGA